VTSYTDSTAVNGTTYYYKVTAVNAVGESDQSNEASATPSAVATAPGAPTGLAAAAGNSQVSLSWSAPASNGGSAITGYNIYRSTTSGTEIKVASPAGTGTTYTDTSLVNGTAYFYKVSAVNAISEGSLSIEASATPATVPGAPTGLIASAGAGQVTLNWTAPSSNGGSAVTGYKVYQGTTSGNKLLVATLGNVTTTTRTGLANGTTYYFTVTAVNAAGEGAQATEANATPLGAPGAPTNLSATRGNGQVALTWSAPASNGGSAITAYKLYRGTATNTETLIQTLGNVTSYTDPGLANGTTYYYKVTAVNTVGESALSTESSATPATVPGAPAGLTATAGNNQVSLSWTAPSNGGAAISAYKVYRSTTSGAEAILTTLGNVTTYTNTGLAAGTTYFYKVSAVNAVGEGTQSGEASATPVAAPPLLGEGFESGPLSPTWTVIGPLALDTAVWHAGASSARASCVGSACWAWRPFASAQTATDLYVQAWVFVTAQDNNTTTLLKLRTGSSGSGTSVLGIQLNNKGRLSYRNDAAGRTVTGTHLVTPGVWHSITVHLIVGTTGHIDLWLDGTPLTELNRTDNFGTAAIAKLQIGENSSGGTFDVRFDDLSASTSPISP
jgi:fibronectin type 3 domain-containing protein